MGSLKERAFLLKTHATVSGVKKHIDVNILQFIRKKSLRIFFCPAKTVVFSPGKLCSFFGQETISCSGRVFKTDIKSLRLGNIAVWQR